MLAIFLFLLTLADENDKGGSLRCAWIHAIGRISLIRLLKDLRLCVQHLEDHCFHESYVREAQMALFTGE